MIKEVNIKQLLSSLAVVAAFLLLIAGYTPGVALPLYIGLLLFLFWFNVRDSETLVNKRGWLIAPVIMALAVHSFVSASFLFRWLNWPLMTVLFIFMCLVLTGQWTFRTRFFATTERFAIGAVMPFAFFGLPFTGSKYLGKSKHLKGVLIGLFISIPLMAVLVAMLSSGDLIFSGAVDAMAKQIQKWIKLPDLFSVVQAFIIGFYALGAAAFTLSKPMRTFLNESRKPSLNPLSVIMVQCTFILVYTAFTIIQFRYLFGGADGGGELPFGLTYAAYARRGFFEMIALSLFNFCFILPIAWLSRDSERARLIKALSSVICGFTLVLLASSFFRMFIYEQAYGYTVLRLLVYSFILFESIAVIMTLIYIYNGRFNIAFGYAAAGLAVYVALNFVNLDAVIANRNIDRYLSGQANKLDTDYLSNLSADALPAVYRYSEDHPEASLNGYFFNLKCKLLYDQKHGGWQEWNISRSRALRLLEDIEVGEQDIESYGAPRFMF